MTRWAETARAAPSPQEIERGDRVAGGCQNIIPYWRPRRNLTFYEFCLG